MNYTLYPPFRDTSRCHDRGYWFEQFINMFATDKTLQVDAKQLKNHEYLFRLADANTRPVTSNMFDEKTYNQTFRYVRNSSQEGSAGFVKVDSAHDVRYIRVSGRPGGNANEYMITHVTATDNFYPPAMLMAMFMEFDRQEKIERFGPDDHKRKMLRLTEGQLFTAMATLQELGGALEVSQDMEKVVELLHAFHKQTFRMHGETTHLHFNLDQKKVWR